MNSEYPLPEKLGTKTSQIWEFIFGIFGIFVGFICPRVCLSICVCNIHNTARVTLSILSQISYPSPLFQATLLWALGETSVYLDLPTVTLGLSHLALCGFSGFELRSSGLPCLYSATSLWLLPSFLDFWIRNAQLVLCFGTGLAVSALCCIYKHSNK